MGKEYIVDGDSRPERSPQAAASNRFTPAPGPTESAQEGFWIAERSEDVVARCIQIAGVEATPEGYKEKGRLRQPDRSRFKSWPHPVIANGCLYLRDDDVLLCYDVKAK